MIWLTIVVFVVLLLALVLVHEWGHFIAAKKAGCRVEEFGFGFPPRLFSVTWHDTIYSFNLLPIGGFVKIEGEDMGDANPPATSFASKTATWRITILAAGVAMNVVLAAVLLAVQGVIGVPVLVTEDNEASLANQLTYIVAVAPNSPANEAGLKDLDRIVRVQEISQPRIEDVQRLAAERAGEPLVLEVDQQGQRRELTVTPRLDPPPGEGALGISLAATGLTKVAWWQAPWHGVVRTGQMLSGIVGQFAAALHRLASEGTVGDNLAGPVGIAVLTNEVTQLGPSYVLEFAALISLNLALINILPLPALDGGRILFVIIERLIGRRLPGKVEYATHTAGFAFLILLMLAITFKDIQRFFT